MISVLTSVYNESLRDIKTAVDSILNQTYSDFEFIVVLDNPENEEAKALLIQYAEKDCRVKVIFNETNIGLAMCMNKARDVARGEYLLRMDADDISTPDRFEIQKRAMESGEYDLICSDFDYIDEDGNPLDKKTSTLSGNQISKLLPLRNVIHHPTVIMTAEIFDKAGGYRNYPCAQDYDLWLRLKVVGCRFHMLKEKLLHYRIRTTSTTTQRRYKQIVTQEYIRSLYKSKMEGYSYEKYHEYLEKKGADSKDCHIDYAKQLEKYQTCLKVIKKGRIFSGIFGLLKIQLTSKYFRPHFLRTLRFALIKKHTK